MPDKVDVPFLPANFFAGFGHIAVAIGFCLVQIPLFYTAISLHLMSPAIAGIWILITWGSQVWGSVFGDLRAKELAVTFAVTSAIGGLLAVVHLF